MPCRRQTKEGTLLFVAVRGIVPVADDEDTFWGGGDSVSLPVGKCWGRNFPA